MAAHRDASPPLIHGFLREARKHHRGPARTPPQPAAVRRRGGLSQQEVASAVGVSTRLYQDWESGSRQIPVHRLERARGGPGARLRPPRRALVHRRGASAARPGPARPPGGERLGVVPARPAGAGDRRGRRLAHRGEQHRLAAALPHRRRASPPTCCVSCCSARTRAGCAGSGRAAGPPRTCGNCALRRRPGAARSCGGSSRRCGSTRTCSGCGGRWTSRTASRCTRRPGADHRPAGRWPSAAGADAGVLPRARPAPADGDLPADPAAGLRGRVGAGGSRRCRSAEGDLRGGRRLALPGDQQRRGQQQHARRPRSPYAGRRARRARPTARSAPRWSRCS